MEHHFTDTQDSTLAGAWWAASAASPELAWMFDAHRQVLTITTRSGARSEHRLSGKRLVGPDAKRTFLPTLALHLSRRVSQSRD